MTRNLKADITRCAGRCWGRIMEGPRRQGGIVVVDPVYHDDYLSQAIDSASILDTSTDNVAQTILSIAKVQTGHKLAIALTNHDDTKHKNKIPELLAEYNKLDDFTTPEAMLPTK